MRHGLERAAETVAELAGSLGHSAQDPLLAGQEGAQFVLVADRGSPEHDGFGLFEGHYRRLFVERDVERFDPQE